MASQRLDYERVALILVEALFYGDIQTAEKWGITERTIRNYKSRLAEDSELSVIFQEKRILFEANWADEIPAAIRSTIEFMRKAATDADPTDPNAIHAIVGAFKILAEVDITRRIINARYGGITGQDGAPDSEVGSGQIQASN